MSQEIHLSHLWYTKDRPAQDPRALEAPWSFLFTDCWLTLAALSSQCPFCMRPQSATLHGVSQDGLCSYTMTFWPLPLGISSSTQPSHCLLSSGFHKNRSDLHNLEKGSWGWLSSKPESLRGLSPLDRESNAEK